MIFYSSYFWILLILSSLLRIKLHEKKQVHLMFLAAINLLVLSVVNPMNVLFMLFILALYLGLQKLTGKWPALLMTLIAGILIKNILALTLPMSISFLMLAVLGLLYRKSSLQPDLLIKATLFPLIQVGPIVRAEDVVENNHSPEDTKEAVLLIMAGFICLSLGSSQLGIFSKKIVDSADLVLHFFSILNLMFLNFQGAVLIALGSAELLGFKISPNFNSPYFAVSMRDFWGRWHISLGRFFSEHIFQPMQLFLSSKTERPSKTQIAIIKFATLVFTWQLIALWHRTTWSFALWGLFNALLIALPLEKLKLNRVPFILILIWISHILFLSPDLAFLKEYFTSISHMRVLPDRFDMAKIVVILLNIALFYLSQKLFCWKEKIFEYLNTHALVYYVLLIAMFFVSLVYHYKGQFIIYGQF